MRAFCHINELGQDGMTLLSPLILFTQHLSLFGPSGVILKAAHEAERTKISPADLIELVERGHVKIIAREDWINNGPHRRKLADRWRGAEFLPEFDNRIRHIFEDDFDLRPERRNRRVQALPAENGYNEADRLISENSHRYRQARQFIKAEIMPAGTRERIEAERSKNPTAWDRAKIMLPARELLRDAVNHEDARVACDAAITVESELCSAAQLGVLSGRPFDEPSPTGGALTRDTLKEVIEIARSFQGKENVRDLIALKENSTEWGLIWDLLVAESDKRRTLARQLDRASDYKNFYEELFGANLTERAATLFALGLSAVGLALALYARNMRLNVLLGISSFVADSFLPTLNLLRRYSVIPDNSYSGPRWPSLFVLGKANPSRREQEAVSRYCLKKLGYDLYYRN